MWEDIVDPGGTGGEGLFREEMFVPTVLYDPERRRSVRAENGRPSRA